MKIAKIPTFTHNCKIATYKTYAIYHKYQKIWSAISHDSFLSKQRVFSFFFINVTDSKEEVSNYKSNVIERSCFSFKAIYFVTSNASIHWKDIRPPLQPVDMLLFLWHRNKKWKKSSNKYIFRETCDSDKKLHWLNTRYNMKPTSN